MQDDDENKKVGDKKKSKSKTKKEAQLVIRLELELRDRFIEACQNIDSSASRQLRGFIKKFLKSYDKGEFED